MNVKILIALFAVVTLLQIYHCKPTHRFIRETNDEDEGRINKIKEFINQFYGGSSSHPQPPPTQPGSTSPYKPESSTPYQPGPSTPYQPDLSTSPIEETPSGVESYD